MTDEQRGRALRLRRPDCVECLFPHGAHSWRLPRVVVGKTKVGGIDLNKARMRWVVEALIALCVSSSEARGFTASHLARQVRLLSNQAESEYGPRRATYDLKKLRAKNIVQRIGQTRRYESSASGLRAMVALVVLRNKAIKALVSRRSTPAQIARPTKSKTHR